MHEFSPTLRSPSLYLRVGGRAVQLKGTTLSLSLHIVIRPLE